MIWQTAAEILTKSVFHLFHFLSTLLVSPRKAFRPLIEEPHAQLDKEPQARELSHKCNRWIRQTWLCAATAQTRRQLLQLLLGWRAVWVLRQTPLVLSQTQKSRLVSPHPFVTSKEQTLLLAPSVSWHTQAVLRFPQHYTFAVALRWIVWLRAPRILKIFYREHTLLHWQKIQGQGTANESKTWTLHRDIQVHCQTQAR